MTQKTLHELKFSIIIESETNDEYDLDDIGELIAADIYEIFNNNEDYFEVYYRGAEKIWKSSTSKEISAASAPDSKISKKMK